LGIEKKNEMTTDKNDNFEDEFKRIGLNSFFRNEDDKNINWKEFFQLTDEEKFHAANNDQIIEEDKEEDKIWSKF